MRRYSWVLWMSLCTWFSACQGDKQVDKVEVKERSEVLIHYMSWYGGQQDGEDSLRHWQFGHANTPLIGAYDSHTSSTLYYHLLLAWSAGIDGVVVNVKDEYDRLGMGFLLQAIKELDSLSQDGFDFKFSISFDDQGFDLVSPLDTTLFKLEQFKARYVDQNDHYLRYDQKPVFYSFDYPNKYLTAQGLNQSLDSIFGKEQSILIWNTFGEGENTQDYVDAFYPWVQPGGQWMADGSNWGKFYLDYFYDQVNQFENKTYPFIGGGVWPGFDDRKNTSWGGNRLISRSGGATYDSTWMYIHKYQGEIPMKYIMVETWNDWNEGTEIEPSVEHGFQNLIQTEQHIGTLKGDSTDGNQLKYEVAVAIRQMMHKAENDSTLGKEAVHAAIQLFLKKKYTESKRLLDLE